MSNDSCCRYAAQHAWFDDQITGDVVCATCGVVSRDERVLIDSSSLTDQVCRMDGMKPSRHRRRARSGVDRVLFGAGTREALALHALARRYDLDVNMLALTAARCGDTTCPTTLARAVYHLTGQQPPDDRHGACKETTVMSC
jgi:hypothetical protein